MNKIPCKKCPQCGRFNDFTIEECECGEKLNNIGVQFIDTDELSSEQRGEIDVSLKVYVQKCSACGTLNFTTSKDNPAKICHNCHKSRVADVEPVIYTSEDENVASLDANSNRESKSVGASETHNYRTTEIKTASQVNDDEDDDSNAQDILWIGELKEKIDKAVPRNLNLNLNKEEKHETEFSSPTPYNDDSDDEDDIVDWPADLGESRKRNFSPISNRQTVASAAKKDITLTATHYGCLSFTVEAGPNTYMMGRSANQGVFLSQDGRVGNEHCYLFYRDGNWFVKDNNSRNGTAVNSRDIGLNGECMLSDGDELKLGHNNDSVAFRISIG